MSLKRVLKKLNLKGHVHTFRHAFISRALTSGIPEAVVRSWVGHVDREILKLYTHIANAVSQAAMRRLTSQADKAAEPSQQPAASDHTALGEETTDGETSSAQIQHNNERSHHDDRAK